MKLKSLKYFALILALLLCFALYSCTKNEEILESSSSETSTSNETTTPDETSTSDESTSLDESTLPDEATIPDDTTTPDDTQQDKNIFELVSIIYDNSLLRAIETFEGTMDELNELYPIECVRKTEFDSYQAYKVSYLGEDKVVVVIFDISGNKCMSWIYNLNSLKADFENLRIGQTVADVKNVDPNGYYWFLITGTGEPLCSDHYTRDGYLITIEYEIEDNTFKVADITIKLI